MDFTFDADFSDQMLSAIRDLEQALDDGCSCRDEAFPREMLDLIVYLDSILDSAAAEFLAEYIRRESYIVGFRRYMRCIKGVHYDNLMIRSRLALSRQFIP